MISTPKGHPARQDPPDLCLTGGQVVDIRTGAVRSASVAITGARISAIGHADTVCAGTRQVLDVSGRFIVPGYIEPHTHVILTNSIEFAGALLRHGTTTAVVDALPLMMLARPERLADVLERLAALPLKLRWLIRLHSQSFAEDGRFTLDTLRRLWRLPSAAAVGEVTRWIDVLDGAPDLLEKIRAAKADGKRVEGHAAGASYERLAALAAAGFTSCHEAITAQEVTDRLRAGLYTMLRHSSIRPDLPELVGAVAGDHSVLPRVMLTVDGPTPIFVEEWGYLDHLLSIAIQNNIPPLDALRMATLNPAAYFGFGDTGEVALGKRADLNVLRDLSDPHPAIVIADGTVVAKDGVLTTPMPGFSWDGIFESLPLPRVAPAALATRSDDSPGCRLINDVITELVAPDAIPEDALHVALIDRGGRWITRSRLAGFADRLGGLATTISSGFDVVALGQDPQDMAHALHRLADAGGGLVMVEGGTEVFRLAFDGTPFSSRPWAEVVEANRRFNALMQARGYRFNDPIFSLLFLTFDSLPWIRLTSRGLWDVRNRRVLVPASPL